MDGLAGNSIRVVALRDELLKQHGYRNPTMTPSQLVSEAYRGYCRLVSHIRFTCGRPWVQPPVGAFTSVKVGLFLFGFHSVPAGTWQTSTVDSWHVNRQVCAHHSPRRLRGGVFAACENLGARCY